MIEPNLKQASPYTEERSKRLQHAYLRMNSLGLGTMALAHLVLAWIYGDVSMGFYFGACAIFGVIYGVLSVRIPHKIYIPVGEILVVLCVAGSQFVLPGGASSAILLFPLGVSLLVISQSLARGAGIFIVGLVVFFTVPLLGVGPSGQPLVPEILSYGVTWLYCGSFLLYQVNKARTSVESALDHLLLTETDLYEKELMLKKYEANLSGINVKLDHNNKKLFDTLVQASKTNVKLESERSSKEELTKAIHRDLRDPLRSIVAANKRLHQKLSADSRAAPIVSYLEFATDGAMRMTTMLDDLLTYTKGDRTQVCEQVDLDSLVMLLRQDLSDLITRSAAILDVKDLPIVEGYQTQLFQLFQNLLTNALKFSRPGVPPRVNIFPAEVQDKPGYFMIRVQDNGVGIPANQIESVFGLFNRAHAEHGYEGSGVGLALCRRIAVAHNSELTVESVAGEGTQFTISFPIDSVIFQPKRNGGVTARSMQIS